MELWNFIRVQCMVFHPLVSFLYTKAGDNPGLAALWDDEKTRRRNKEESSFIQTQFSSDSSRAKGDK